MPCIHHDPFRLRLYLLRPHLQLANHADLVLALGLDSYHIPFLALVLLIRQPSALACKAGRHERCAGQHEADGAAVDAEAGKSLREGVHEFEVRNQGVVHVLPEEGEGVENVEGDAVRSGGVR